MLFRYSCLHIGSGRVEHQTVKAPSREKFLEQLNAWNQKRLGIYQYYTA